jgi:uncharacterized protein YceH (UPF0502 family)
MQRIGQLLALTSKQSLRPASRILQHTRFGPAVIQQTHGAGLRSSKFFYSTAEVKDITEPEVKEVGTIEEAEAEVEVEPLNEKVQPVVERLEQTESVVGEPIHLEFQAETRKLLDIVAKSLYTDKEVKSTPIVFSKYQ